MVFPLLDVVPNKLIGHPDSVLFGERGVLTGWIIVYGEPLSTFAADNGFHQDSMVDSGCPAQTPGYAVEPQDSRSCSVLPDERLPV